MFACIIICNIIFGQVGINTSTPRGVLDVFSPQKNQGMVLPSVLNIEEIIDPQTNSTDVPLGTMAYDLGRDAICIKFNNVWQCTSANGQVENIQPGYRPFSPNYTYIKGSINYADLKLGNSVSFSDNGTLLAVGAIGDKGSSSGVAATQSNDGLTAVGAVFIFRRTGDTWQQENYIKASNPRANGSFGGVVRLSGDGSTLAVGSAGETGGSAGINGDQSSANLNTAGAVYVFKRTANGSWEQEAYVKASNARANSYFGSTVSLSKDGSVLAVGANEESSNAKGINGDQSNQSLTRAGAVFVFKRTNGNWVQDAYIKASNTSAQAQFGSGVSLSSDGKKLAVSSPLESSNAVGINGNEANTSANYAGAVYIFSDNNGSWSQEAYIKASNTKADQRFGDGIYLSGDGTTLAVGAPLEKSNATGVNGIQTNTSLNYAGAVYIFRNENGQWSQEAYIKASNTRASAQFGSEVTLSRDGSVLAVTALGESSNATLINQNQANTSMAWSGAVYVFKRINNNNWEQEAYVKASNTNANSYFGTGISLNATGSMLAIGSSWENSSSTGINGNQTDLTVAKSGSVYVTRRE